MPKKIRALSSESTSSSDIMRFLQMSATELAASLASNQENAYLMLEAARTNLSSSKSKIIVGEVLKTTPSSDLVALCSTVSILLEIEQKGKKTALSFSDLDSRIKFHCDKNITYLSLLQMIDTQLEGVSKKLVSGAKSEIKVLELKNKISNEVSKVNQIVLSETDSKVLSEDDYKAFVKVLEHFPVSSKVIHVNLLNSALNFFDYQNASKLLCLITKEELEFGISFINSLADNKLPVAQTLLQTVALELNQIYNSAASSFDGSTELYSLILKLKLSEVLPDLVSQLRDDFSVKDSKDLSSIEILSDIAENHSNNPRKEEALNKIKELTFSSQDNKNLLDVLEKDLSFFIFMRLGHYAYNKIDVKSAQLIFNKISLMDGFYGGMGFLQLATILKEESQEAVSKKEATGDGEGLYPKLSFLSSDTDVSLLLEKAIQKYPDIYTRTEKPSILLELALLYSDKNMIDQFSSCVKNALQQGEKMVQGTELNTIISKLVEYVDNIGIADNYKEIVFTAILGMKDLDISTKYKVEFQYKNLISKMHDTKSSPPSKKDLKPSDEDTKKLLEKEEFVLKQKAVLEDSCRVKKDIASHDFNTKIETIKLDAVEQKKELKIRHGEEYAKLRQDYLVDKTITKEEYCEKSLLHTAEAIEKERVMIDEKMNLLLQKTSDDYNSEIQSIEQHFHTQLTLLETHSVDYLGDQGGGFDS